MAFEILDVHLVGQAELEEFVAGVEDVGAPVAEGSHTEVVPATPVAFVEPVAVFVEHRLALPNVPVHSFGDGFGIGELLDIGVEHVPAAVVVHVGDNLCDVLDEAGLHPVLELVVLLARMALVTHLGNNLGVLARSRHNELVLVERAAERLLAVNVDAFLDRPHGDGEMRKVRRGYEHRLDLRMHLVEHLAEVLVALCLGEHSHHLEGVGCAHVDVAQGHHVGKTGGRHHLGVLQSAESDADEGDVNLAVSTHDAFCTRGAGCFAAEGLAPVEGHGRSGDAGGLQKVSTVYHIVNALFAKNYSPVSSLRALL